MAAHVIKTTYALDVETVRSLEGLAARWGVSKSEALRRAVRASAAGSPSAGPLPAVEALERLQRDLRLDAAEAVRWATSVRADRQAASRRRESRVR